MKNCPSCGRTYKDDIMFCPLDGSKLEKLTGKVSIFPGQLLDNKYEVNEALDLEGKWSVYSGTELSTDRSVVIRVYTTPLQNRHNFTAFSENLQKIKQLSYFGFAKVIDFGTTVENFPYVITEKVKGNSLHKVIRDVGSLSAPLCLSVMKQILEIIHVAHRNQVFHLDLRPSKIFLLENHGAGQFVKIVGFAEAELSKGTSSTGKVGENFSNYTAPEILSGGSVDARCDIYSAGIIFYEMFTGILPFPSGVWMNNANASPEPPPMKRVKPSLNISRRLENAIAKAIQWQPQRRFRDAQSFLHTIANVKVQSSLTKTHLVGMGLVLVVAVIWYLRPKFFSQVEGVKTYFAPTDSTKVSGTISKISGAKTVAVVTKTPQQQFQEEFARIIPMANHENAVENMKYIPGGKTVIGSNYGDDDEKPVQVVDVAGFYIDIKEVTNEDYQKFIHKTGHRPPQHWQNGRYALGEQYFPVTNVSHL